VPSRTSAKAPHDLGRSVPVGLRIPAIGVDTPVMQLGLAADGSVQVPPITAHDRAGWYRNSPTPGQTGPSVILGHVTVGAYGDGVFRRLAQLRKGDRITARRPRSPSPPYGRSPRPTSRRTRCTGTWTVPSYGSSRAEEPVPVRATSTT
jgi:hypothetical protein